ncbi:MAG: hypothetical protein ACKOPS_18105 [Cyanobium sp.]
MADETSTTTPQGARGGGNREPGGFRIRLSDNEMRSARALQEAFRLRSTVAVLGFCVRTLGQMLEEGKLDELVEQQRSQAGNRGADLSDETTSETSEAALTDGSATEQAAADQPAADATTAES